MSQNLHSIQPQPRATVPAVTEAAPIYYGILTDQGQALLAAAIASGTPLPLTAMAAGDGGGQPVTPLAEMTELVNEVHRAPLNQLFVDPTAPNQIVAEMVMAETVGGFWIRELGLFAESGELFAVCNTPDSYKPVLAEGAGRSLLTRMILIVSDTAAVELIINPDTVMASRAYVDAKLAEHAASRDHPAATEGAQGMIPLATQAMVDEGIDHTSAVTPQTASITFARKTHSHTPQEAGAAPLEHEHEIEDVLWLQEALDEKAEVVHQHEIDDVSGLSTALDGKQPLDATLAALAGLATGADKLPYFTGVDAASLTVLTAFARTLLDDANAAAALTTLGVSTFIQGLLNDADAATARATLGAQASDATLTALAGLATAADKLPYFTGADVATVTGLTAFARTLLDDADAAAARSTLVAAPDGFGLGEYAASIPGADINTGLRNACGFFNGSRGGGGLENAYPNGGEWAYYLNLAHGNSNGYNGVIALSFDGSAIGFKTIESGGDNGWKHIYHTGHKPTAADVGAAPASHSHTMDQVARVTPGSGAGGASLAVNMAGRSIYHVIAILRGRAVWLTAHVTDTSVTFTNRGGENADRDYDGVLNASFDGATLTLSINKEFTAIWALYY